MLRTMINNAPDMPKLDSPSTPSPTVANADTTNSSVSKLPASSSSNSTATTSAKGKRVRTGCLNCRRKHKKCDEAKPICNTCKQKNEICQWPTAKMSATDMKKNMISLNNAGVPLNITTSMNGHKQDLQVNHDQFDRRNSYPLSTVIPPITAPQFSNYTTSALSQPPVLQTIQTNQMGLAQLQPLNQQQQQPGFSHYPVNGQIPIQPQTPLMPQDQLPSTTAGRRLSTTQTPPSSNQMPSILNVPPTYQQQQQRPSVEFLNYTMDLDASHYRRQNSVSPGLSNPNNLLKFQVQSGSESNVTLLQLQKTLHNVMNQSYNDNNYQLRPSSQLTNEARHILLNHYINKIVPKLSLLNPKIFNTYILNLASKSPALMYSILALALQDFSQGNSIQPFKETPLTLLEVALYHLQQQNFQNLKVLSPSFLLLTILLLNITNNRKVWKETLQKMIKFMNRNRIEPNTSQINDSIFWLVVLIDLNITEINLENDKPLIQFDLSTEDFKKTNVENNEEITPKVLTLLNSTINLLNINNDIKDFDANWESLWIKTIQLYDLLLSSNPYNNVVFKYDTSPFPCTIITDQFTSFVHQNIYTIIILLLQNKPRHYKIENTESRAVSWYAKRSCGVSIANNGHNNWFNGEFCLYVSGKLLTHIDEHKLILQCLNDLESQSLLGVVYHSSVINKYWNGNDL